MRGETFSMRRHNATQTDNWLPYDLQIFTKH